MAFHPYPGVIPSVFNRSGFGPPRGLTPASACPWIAHPASRPRRATERPVQTRFRCGSVVLNLAARRDSQAHSTKGTPSRNDCPLRLLVGARFQVLFHSPLGVLFTFPSRYWFAIGHRRVFSLGGWSPRLRTGFHVPGPTRDTRQRSAWFRVRGSHPLRPALPCRSATMWICNRSQVGSTWTRVPQPPGGNACRLHAPGFGLVRFRSPLLAQSRLISLPRGT